MKKISITGAASLYVIAVLLGGLIVFSWFFLPHSGLAIIAYAIGTIAVVAAALYSVWLVVRVVQAQR